MGPRAVARRERAIDLVDRLLAPYAATGAPGAALAVLKDGAPVLERCAGLARLPGTVVTPATAFRLASLTKQFTAAAVSLLVDDGLLSLDTPLRAVLAGIPPWGDAVRIGHLVAHTSGVPHYEDAIGAGTAAQVVDADVAAMMAAVPAPAFPPGSRFEYSNTGYVLLGVVVERVTGGPFGAFLERRIFGPLGMTGTVAHVEGTTTVPHRAYGYRPAGESFVDADQGPTTATLGDGGVYSSIRDLTLWYAALGEPGFAPDPRALEAFAGVGYGYGWYVDTFRGRRRQRHEGWSTGFQHEVQRFPETGLTVIMLTNRASPPVRPIVESIVEVFEP